MSKQELLKAFKQAVKNGDYHQAQALLDKYQS
jgi:hypothetical protein